MENSQDRNSFNTDKEADERIAKEEARAQDQVDAGELNESQVEESKTHLTLGDTVDEVLAGKAEVDPQFAGKNTKERLEEVKGDELTVDDQDKVVQADQEIRAALTQEKEGIPDIPNAEGDDAEVVEGVKEAQADEADNSN